MGFTVELQWGGYEWSWDEIPGTISEQVELFGDLALDERSFDVTDRLLDGISFAKLMASGASLEDFTGRVKFDGEVWLEGQVVDPTWHTDGAVDFTIRERLPVAMWPTGYSFDDSTELADPIQEAIDAANERLDELGLGFNIGTGDSSIDGTATIGDAEGVPPVVFGQPGAGEVPGSEAKMATIDGTRYAICSYGQRRPGETVTLHFQDEDDEWQTVATFPLVTKYDSHGRPFMCGIRADIVHPFTTAVVPDGNKVYVEWDNASGLSGKAGDVVNRILSSIPTRRDTARMGSNYPALQRFRLDTYVDEPVDALELLDDMLEPMPVSLVQGRHGLYVWVWDPDATPIGHITVSTANTDTGAYLDGKIRHASGGPYRSYQLRYKRRVVTDDYLAITHRRTLYHLAASQQRHGDAVVEDSGHIADAGTAQRCADLRIRALGRRPIVVPLTITRERWGHLRAGDPVSLTCDDVGLTERNGVVTRVEDSGTPGIQIEVTIVMEPA